MFLHLGAAAENQRLSSLGKTRPCFDYQNVDYSQHSIQSSWLILFSSCLLLSQTNLHGGHPTH